MQLLEDFKQLANVLNSTQLSADMKSFLSVKFVQLYDEFDVLDDVKLLSCSHELSGYMSCLYNSGALDTQQASLIFDLFGRLTKYTLEF